jgi:hypothetical protein
VSELRLARVISGGQTGVDRAALDVAIELGIPCGGYCPRGRRAEDGKIPAHYLLSETDSPYYPERTARNVADADATLVLVRGKVSGGSSLTVKLARQAGQPVLVVDLEANPEVAAVRVWLAEHAIARLNVAGPRESENPGLHDQAAAFLRAVLGRE